LTDAAKGFVQALAIMKERNLWPNIRHLLCRWHVYEAIKRYCAIYFKRFEKDKQLTEMNRFIKAFRNIVCAPTEEQMRALWETLERDQFPTGAVE
jgi:hypothetical protein